ncbi:MAG: hypothetical protein ACFBSC_13025 [Microcoleaceae cyanobacterium]
MTPPLPLRPPRLDLLFPGSIAAILRFDFRKNESAPVGGSGENLFFGDQGDDLMSGGENRDQFVLFADDGTDTITNFRAELDIIVLENGSTFDQLTVEQDRWQLGGCQSR